MNITFNLTRPKSNAETAIYARITYNYNDIKVYTGISVNPAVWDFKKHKVSERKKNRSIHRPAIAINRQLEKFKGEVEACFYDYCNNHESEPTPATLKKEIDIILGRSKRANFTLYEYFQDFIIRTKSGQRQTAKGKIIAPRTGAHYATTLGLLKEFNPKLSFAGIDLNFYYDWLAWLRDKNYSANNIGAHIKRLKAVLNEATERGFNNNLAFRSKRFVTIKEDVENIALTEKELSLIAGFDLSANKPLGNVRDLFLIGCYTGLRFSDFSRLTVQNIKGGFIEIKQAKTGAPVVIPIHPTVKQILSKHKGKLPPAISNQKTNVALKEICKRIPELKTTTSKTTTKGGVKVSRNYEKWELIGTHTARRSFATNSYLAGIPTVSIMAVTGHKTEKSFLKYIKVTSKQHAKIVAAYWGKQRGQLKAVK